MSASPELWPSLAESELGTSHTIWIECGYHGYKHMYTIHLLASLQTPPSVNGEGGSLGMRLHEHIASLECACKSSFYDFYCSPFDGAADIEVVDVQVAVEPEVGLGELET